MKEIEVKANRTLRFDRLGTIKKDGVVKLPEALAKEYIQRGFVQKYETKVVKEKPADGELTVDVRAPAGVDMEAATPKGKSK
jgi:hypothetical protein